MKILPRLPSFKMNPVLSFVPNFSIIFMSSSVKSIFSPYQITLQWCDQEALILYYKIADIRSIKIDKYYASGASCATVWQGVPNFLMEVKEKKLPDLKKQDTKKQKLPDLKKQDTKKPEVKKMQTESYNGHCPFVPNIGNALQIR